MKRFITILLTFTLFFSVFAVSTFASSSSKGKYVKVKNATYQKYKKAYNNQKKLKAKINKLEKELALKQIDFEDAMDQYEIAMEESEKLEGQNNWIWMNIKSLGISYSDKTWIIPAELPEKFIVNGVTYKVIKEGN